MATVEEAINAHINYCEKQKHPTHSAVFNRGMDIWIRVLESAPRDLTEVQKLLDGRNRKLNEAQTYEQQEPIWDEIQALGWVLMILRGSDKERKARTLW